MTPDHIVVFLDGEPYTHEHGEWYLHREGYRRTLVTVGTTKACLNLKLAIARPDLAMFPQDAA